MDGEGYEVHFMRGYNPVYMDFMGTDTKTTETRVAMGIILRFAERIDLAKMKPAADSTVCSTGYRLYDKGSEYLVYQSGEGAFTVNLPKGA